MNLSACVCATPTPHAGTGFEGFVPSHAGTHAGAKPSQRCGGGGTHVVFRADNRHTAGERPHGTTPRFSGTTCEVIA